MVAMVELGAQAVVGVIEWVAEMYDSTPLPDDTMGQRGTVTERI